ncbi:alpha-L-glutamate ligase-like protein [Sulfurovum sp. zt1-1]|uniref:Alpha-L-glutamate ligase-like protein n=2 Tax=Sulfurovum zhangzhouensis TaxID=3019067 RepID=A0ABT7QY72_9BACT|nr:alpha-L-glutamate ligase-like protein [Sulfurovum zhangzhouensis]
MLFDRIKMLRAKGVIGMNFRNIELIGRYNDRSKYPLVDNKLITKRIAKEAGIAVTELYGKIEWQSQLARLHEMLAPYDSFVIKPVHGSGGKGIVVITHREDDLFIRANGTSMTLTDIHTHITNILSGLYSLGGRYDIAIIEKMVEFDPVFQNYSYEGVPDVRLIVYKGYPMMAMMRCPTHESNGKANLHQGAVGVGIDIATGKAINAVQHNHPVTVHPNTKHDFSGLQIPHWEEILKIGAKCYDMTGLGYLGADIVFDRNVGPLLLELNARPGLAIQIANNKGEYHRVKRIDQEKQERNAEERAAFCINVLSKV